MSFKLFIYYCAVCGGWAAFVAWLVVLVIRRSLGSSALLQTTVTAGLLGILVAGAVGGVDAFLNAAAWRQRLTRILVCLGVGVLGSLLGGLVGQLFKNWILDWDFVGWILVGVAIGASVGVYDLIRAQQEKQPIRMAMRKTLNGVIGGALGGGIGGILYQVLRYGSEHLPRFSLAVGLVILGASIGLLIGLAQVMLKEAWVKIEAGLRAGREMMLSKAETTIGRAESCDIGLFGDNGIDRTHARIVLKGTHYLLADAGSSSGTFLNDVAVKEPTPLRSGDVIRVGNSLLRFGERRKQPKRR